MRILYITQAFPPEPGPTRRPLAQAVQLQRLGHDVTILTTRPSAPLGRVFPGYRWKPWIREQQEGVEVLRTWCLAVPNRGFVLRTLSWVSFALSAALAGLLLRRRDLVIASVPNLGTELAGWLVSRAKRSHFLLEMRDLVPDNLTMIGIDESALFFRLLNRYFGWMYRASNFIAVPSPSMIRALEKRGLPRARLLLLPHAIDEVLPPENDGSPTQGYRPAPDLLAGAGPTALRVLFAGSFSNYYDIPGIVAAGRLLEAEGGDVHIHLLGTGRDRADIEAELQRDPCSIITLLDPVPPDAVRPHLLAADVLLAPYVYGPHTPYLEGSITTKATEYLGAGRAIVAIENHPMLEAVLRESGAGLTVGGGDPAALAAALRHFADDRAAATASGLRALTYARKHLMREPVVARFEQELCRRLDPDRPTRDETTP